MNRALGWPKWNRNFGNLVDPMAAIKEWSCVKVVNSERYQRPNELDRRCKRRSWSAASNAALASNSARKVAASLDGLIYIRNGMD